MIATIELALGIIRSGYATAGEKSGAFKSELLT